MTENEHLLSCLAEECAEVAQRVSKVLRFGLDEVQTGQALDNSQRLAGELVDLQAVLIMLQDRGIIPNPLVSNMDHAIAQKVAKVNKYMDLARELGTLEKS
jgi:hypothetical protein